MNLKERLKQLAEESVIADVEYVDFIETCIIQQLEDAASKGLLSERIDVEALRERCATNPDSKFEGPRAVCWDDGLEKALDRIARADVHIEQDKETCRVFADWSK